MLQTIISSLLIFHFQPNRYNSTSINGKLSSLPLTAFVINVLHEVLPTLDGVIRSQTNEVIKNGMRYRYGIYFSI